MKKPFTARFVITAIVVLLFTTFFMPTWSASTVVFAQDAPVDITETPTEPASPTPTNTQLPTNTPTITPTNTPVTPATNTPIPTDTPTAIITLPPDTSTATPPPSGPVPIPEPVTVVLFGTGLAALSAAVASRRKNEG